MLRNAGAYGIGGRFVLEEAVGTGSMGTVFRARDTRDDRLVAIKALKSMDPGDQRRFEREFAIVSRLAHPAVVTCWETGQTEAGERYLVMEWLEGESLRERLRRAELTLDETLALSVCLLGGLMHAHEQGVVHRDVKPANVFLVGGEVARAKLVDFGIARYAEEGETLTRAGEIVGTPGYVSPEQVQGRRVDARSDVYSLGCLMFRCLAGRSVFEDDNVLEVLVRVTRDRAPSLGELRPDLPSDLANLVDRMLEREPLDRPADTATVISELELLIARRGPLADPSLLASAPKPSPRTSSRGRPVDRPQAERSASSRSTSLNAGVSVVRTPRSRLRGLFVVAGLAVISIPAVAWLLRGPPPHTLQAAAMPSASAITGPSLAPTETIVAKDAQPAWGAIKIGSRAAALRLLSTRVQDKTASASELLWYALLAPAGEEAKRQLRAASVRSAELNPAERRILTAAGPLLQTPSDFRSADGALTQLATDLQSAELWLVLSRLRTQMSDEKGAHAALDRVSRGEWWTAAQVDRVWLEREFFDAAGSRAAAITCVEARPDAVDCIAALARRAALDGDCAKMDEHARRWVGTDPDDPLAYEMVAFALAARGEGDPPLLEAFEQKWARLSERERPAAMLRDRINLEALRGRFDKAATLARNAVATLPTDAPLLQRLVASFIHLAMASEMGDRRAVAEIAEGVLERGSGTTPATASEAAHYLLFAAASERPDDDQRWAALRRAAIARFDDYLPSQGSNLRPSQRVLPWIVGYAAGAESAARIKAAYEARNRYGELLPPGLFTDDNDLVTGVVLAESGERERGLAYLRRVSASCLILESPLAVGRGHAALGLALERYRETDAARAAYGRVLTLWGTNAPTSRSVLRAKAGLARLATREP